MLKVTAKILIMVMLSVALVSAAFLGGFATSRIVLSGNQAVTGQSNDGSPVEFRASMPVFWEAWNIVKNNFYKQPIDETELSYGAVGGMVDSLGDPHTQFVQPEGAKLINSDLEGTFEGIGATVEMRNGRLTIVSPIKGTPADRAGLKANDVILQVDDTQIVNMTVEDAIKIIRGPKGSTVRLKVQRGSQPAFDISLQRDTIQVPVVEAKTLEDNVAYIKLNEFTATAPGALHNALQEAMAKNPKALIFDLRNNPGGFLDSAVKIASEFIPADNVVLVEAFKSGEKQFYKTESGGLATQVPIVLLVNGGSASASEILAGALRDYNRAEIIGTTTYGKGSVQTPHSLSDQSQLRVTIAHFLSPKEHEINGVGIKPDIVVDDPTAAQDVRGDDPQLDRAVEYVKSGAQIESPFRQVLKWEWLPRLPQLFQSMNSLQILEHRIWVNYDQSIRGG